MESLHSHRLALVPGPVDDGATAPLAQDAALTLRVLQPAVLQEEPAGHTAQGLASDLGQGVAWAQLMLSHPGEQIKVTCVLARIYHTPGGQPGQLYNLVKPQSPPLCGGHIPETPGEVA